MHASPLTAHDYVAMPSGLLLPEPVAEREIRKLKRPTGIDFFAGAGGFTLGVIQAGFEVVAAVEKDPVCVMTYMTNLCRFGEVQVHFVSDEDGEALEKALAKSFKNSGLNISKGKLVQDGKVGGSIPVAGSGWIRSQPRSTPGVSHIFVGDARELSSERILETIGVKRGELDCVFGGPPCQGYSTSGKRNIYDDRNSLVFEFARFVCELNPKTMIMEEVTGILSMVTPDGHPVVDQLCRILEDGGFGGYKAFRKALETQTGGIGLLRGKDISEKAEKPAPKPKTDQQADLFAEASVQQEERL